MTPEALNRFGSVSAVLRNGVRIRIRPLAPDDGERLAAFYAAVPRRDIRFYCPHPLTRDRALHNARAAHDPRETVLVLVTADDRIGGYAWIRKREPAAADGGFGICVLPEFQGGGAGRALMERLFALTRLLGPPMVHLTVQKANGRAVALYQSMGFRIVREQMRSARDEFPAESEYVMEWRADAPPPVRNPPNPECR